MDDVLKLLKEIDFSQLPKDKRKRRLTTLQVIGYVAALLILAPIIAYPISIELSATIIVFEGLSLYLLFPALGIILLNFSSFSMNRQLRALTEQGKQESATIEAFAKSNYLRQGSFITPKPEDEPGSLFRFGTGHTCANAVYGEFMGLEYVCISTNTSLALVTDIIGVSRTRLWRLHCLVLYLSLLLTHGCTARATPSRPCHSYSTEVKK